MEGRIIQALLLTAIAAIIAGSLLVEYWAGPRYRRWRARRRHRHAAQLLSYYRSLRRTFRTSGLEDVWAELAGQPRVPAGYASDVTEIQASAVLSPSLGENN